MDHEQDRPPLKHEHLFVNENIAAMEAAQRAYDSTVTIFSNNKKVADFPAHGKILVLWNRSDANSSPGEVIFTQPDQTLVTLEPDVNSTFQIDTPTGKTLTGEKQYLEFLGQDGNVANKSVAVGTIINGLIPKFGDNSNGEHKEIFWTDEQGVSHEKSLGDTTWIISSKPIIR
jgi:hypothetical protein